MRPDRISKTHYPDELTQAMSMLELIVVSGAGRYSKGI